MNRTDRYNHSCWLILVVAAAILAGCSATGKIIKRGDEALARSDYYAASLEYLEVLKAKPKHGKALAKLAEVSEPAYDQKLELAKGYREQGDLKAALREYKELDRFLEKLKQHNSLNFVTVNVDREIENVSADAAEKHYQKAEALFDSTEFELAIAQYRKALDLTKPYKDCDDKIAASYYQMAAGEKANGNYRQAASNFALAHLQVKGYQDAAARAAALYYALGDYFLSTGQCRQAHNDFGRAYNLNASFMDMAAKLSEAKECATVKIAFVKFDNPTGKNLAGMALGDFIFETIKTKVQARASQFIRILDREQLHVLAQEQQISSGALESETAPSGLEGVHYLVFGKINQVRDVHAGLSKTPVQTTYDYWYEVPYTDSKGKRKTKTEWAKGNLYYSMFSDKRTVKLAGSIRVVEAKTGAVKINQQISEEAHDAVSYGDQFRAAHELNAYNVQLPDEIKSIAKARRDLVDVDTLAKGMIDNIASSMASRILSELDRTPHAQDPATLSITGSYSSN